MKQFKHDIVNIPKTYLDSSNNTHRYRSPSGKQLDSVTTMLGKTKTEESKRQLEEWRDNVGHEVADYIFRNAAVVGTQTHLLNENYLNMIQTTKDCLLISHAHHQNFIPYLDKVSVVHGIEAKLFSEEMGLAGTADLVAVYDGKLSIIDYKTKRSFQAEEWINDYFLQTTAYSIMWEEITGMKIEQLVILVSSEKNTMQEFTSTPGQHVEELNNRIKIYFS